MKTKSPRRPLTGAALSKAMKEHTADVEKIGQANELVDKILHLVNSQGRVSMSDLPNDPYVLQFALRELVNFFLRSRDRLNKALEDERSFRVTEATRHSAQMAEATETINALKTTLRALLK